MKLQLLISTMNQKNYDLIKEMRLLSNAVIINQCNMNSENKVNYGKNTFIWINSRERGLSKSRNLAIDNATEDICVLADDDLEYLSEYEKIILKNFELHPNTDIIVFQVEGIESKFKDYYPKLRKINYLTSMKVSSVEIAFKLNKIKELGITFNESFGAGAKYSMGEENLFLIECLKKNLRVLYVPEKIANLHIGESTWFEGYNDNYFMSKGALFTAMSHYISIILIIQFAIRKRRLYSDEKKFSKAVKMMLLGRKMYLEEKHGEI